MTKEKIMNIQQTVKTSIGFLLTLLFIACGGGGSPESDEEPFSIQSTYPANGAKGVALDSKMKITFNKPIDEIDQASVTMSSFSLMDKASNSVSGTFTFIGNSIIFTPFDELDPDTTYILTINKGIRDRERRSLGLSQGIQFNTIDPNQPATSEPKMTQEPKAVFKVTKTSPSDDSVDVSLDSKILVYFNEDVARSSVNKQSVKIYDSSNTEIEMTLQSSNNHLTIEPKSDLEPESLYRVELLKGIKDTKGNALEAYGFGFRTKKKVVEKKNTPPIRPQPINPVNPDKGKNALPDVGQVPVVVRYGRKTEYLQTSDIFLYFNKEVRIDWGILQIKTTGRELEVHHIFVPEKDSTVYDSHPLTPSYTSYVSNYDGQGTKPYYGHFHIRVTGGAKTLSATQSLTLNAEAIRDREGRNPSSDLTFILH